MSPCIDGEGRNALVAFLAERCLSWDPIVAHRAGEALRDLLGLPRAA